MEVNNAELHSVVSQQLLTFAAMTNGGQWKISNENDLINLVAWPVQGVYAARNNLDKRPLLSRARISGESPRPNKQKDINSDGWASYRSCGEFNWTGLMIWDD